jgi:CheY-like chemotaxis protein
MISLHAQLSPSSLLLGFAGAWLYSDAILEGCCGAIVTEKSRVLLVDDDEIFGQATARLLAKAGLDVIVAPDYREALQLLECDAPVDLLLTDIVMPDRVNGLALARMARLRRPTLKIIYISGYDIPQIADEALGLVLHKPIDDERLVDEVQRILAEG